MKIDELRKEVTAPETKEVVKILEGLDKTSIVLAKVYLTALGDRQELEGWGSRNRKSAEVSQVV